MAMKGTPRFKFIHGQALRMGANLHVLRQVALCWDTLGQSA